MRRLIALDLVLTAFLAMTAYAVWTHGYVGFFEAMAANAATQLAMLDLAIVLGLFTLWQWRDAGERSLPFFPYAAITLLFGAAGPLAYLFHRELREVLAARAARAGRRSEALA